MIKGFKIRIYPTKEQEALIWKHIHASRFIWNYMLAMQEENYANGGKFITAFSMNKLLTPLKKQDDFIWLRDVSNTMLQRTCADLADAYNRFFKGAGHPKFKSRKRAKTTFPIRCDAMRLVDGCVVVQKIGHIKYKSDYDLPCNKSAIFSNARIAFHNGKYMLSFGMERENQAPKLNDFSMGIDLGIKELAVVACGEERIVFHNINKSNAVHRINQRSRHIQRGISRKYEAQKRRKGRHEKSNNIIRQEDKLRRLHARKANIRQNYIHQTTHKLVSMLPKAVVMEDLNVSGVMKNRHLSKAVAEQGFYEFIRQMRYKCEWNGIPFVQVDRFYPSSKTCSRCGAIKHDLELSDRTYVCECCGLTIDRDYNAAINLMRYADHATRAAA